jgi:hypothetical protein
MLIQDGEVYHRSHFPIFLWNKKKAGIETWSKRRAGSLILQHLSAEECEPLLEATDSCLGPLSLTCSEELMTMEVDSGTEVPDPPPAVLKEPTCLK